MEKIPWRMVAGFAMAFVIVVIVNFYVFDRTSGLLGFGDFYLSLAYAIALSGLLLTGFLVRTSSISGTRGLFVAVTTVYGLEFSMFSVLIPFEILSLFFNIPGLLAGQAMVAFVIVIALVSAVNSQFVRARKVALSFPRKLRVVQLSDLHIGAVHGKSYLAKVVNMVNELDPDMVLITGDIISGAVSPGQSSLGGFAGLKARTFLAPGNHEYYEGMDEMREALPKNVEILRDEEVKFDGFSIFGLDFLGEQGVSGQRKLERKFDNAVIAMAHVPQFLPLPKGSIILSGHYHAGQVFPFNFLGYLFIKYFRGLYEKDGVRLYVSPGSATWGPSMRFGSINEITLLELGPD